MPYQGFLSLAIDSKRRLRLLALLAGSAFWSFLCPPRLPAQVLITGENGGKGSQAVMVSANRIQPDDFGKLANFWAQYGHGLTDRVDAFASYGNITVFGRTQHYVAVGSNIGLLGRSRAGVDVALYNNVTFSLNHRAQGSPVLLISALIASRPFRAAEHTVTPYGGVNRLSPIGKADDPVFTSASAVHTGIAGISVTFGKLILFAEFNPGRAQHSGGIGLLYAF